MKTLTNQPLLAETDASLIRAELERLLSDRRFSGARQMSAFLRYIVSETLDGNGNRIKAYTVGVDALGKADDFDAQTDPSVRVLALRLRKSLKMAYADEPECHARIAMSVGSYVPEFYKPHSFNSTTDAQGSSASDNVAMGINRRVVSGESTVARSALSPEAVTTALRGKWSVNTAVLLLAAALQMSIDTASSAIVPTGAGTGDAKAQSPGQIAQRAGRLPITWKK